MTRSASVTMPTQRPPSLTTGTPGNSWSRSVRTTVSTSSSGATVIGSPSMMSATVRAMKAGTLPTTDRRSPRVRQRLDHIAGDDAVDATLTGGVDACAGVQAHPGARGRERLDAARQHGRDDAAEHVAGAGGRQ